MDYYQLVATISLVVEVVVLVLLFGGYSLKRMKKFRQHGITMLTAVVLHTVMILAWMIPSLSSFFSSPSSTNLANIIVVTTLVHAFMGIATDILGIWLVASLASAGGYEDLFRKKEDHARHTDTMANSAGSWHHSVPENYSAILVG